MNGLEQQSVGLFVVLLLLLMLLLVVAVVDGNCRQADAIVKSEGAGEFTNFVHLGGGGGWGVGVGLL